jgi:hypothetical protein
VRVVNGFSDEIYVQRSQWNMAGSECELYVNLYSDSGEVIPSRTNFASFVRVSRPSILQYPDYYQKYLDLPAGSPERDRTWTSFLPNQLAEITRTVRSRDWQYSSEEGLCEVLQVVASELETTGLQYFDQAHSLLAQGLRGNLGNFSQQWELSQLGRSIRPND